MFLVTATSGHRGMAVAMSGSPTTEIITESSVDGAAETVGRRGKCANMVDCINHLGTHCLSIAIVRHSLIPAYVAADSGLSAIRRTEAADDATPGARFRPPIV